MLNSDAFGPIPEMTIAFCGRGTTWSLTSGQSYKGPAKVMPQIEPWKSASTPHQPAQSPEFRCPYGYVLAHFWLGFVDSGFGRQREDALSGIVALRDRIVTARAETLADAAVQLRRLVVMAEEEPRPHALLASPDARLGRLGPGGGRARGGPQSGSRRNLP